MYALSGQFFFMEKFDYILSGGGCAGLSLAFHLIQSRLKESKILIIDPVLDQIPNKTWCYWHDNPLPIHPENSVFFWNSLVFQDRNNSLKKSLNNLNYYHLNSHDFFGSVRKKLNDYPNISFVQDEVVETMEDQEGIIVKTSKNQLFRGSLVFDSRVNSSENFDNKLKQVFLGWKIETANATFFPDRFTMMDFNTKSGADFDFFYILPFSEREALVEYTTYTTDRVPEDVLETRLRNYLKNTFGDEHFNVTFTESGVIPMSTKLGIPDQGKRIIPIGTKAGWTKPSTGYTFYQIQENCKKIVGNLEKGELNKLNFKRKNRFVFYDSILLTIAHKWPSELKKVFLDLFKSAPADLVFRFLSEKTTFLEELKLLSGLKFGIFIKSLFHYEPR